MPCLWTGKFNIIKISIPHQNSNSLIFIIVFRVTGRLVESENCDSKIPIERPKVKISQDTLEEELDVKT